MSQPFLVELTYRIYYTHCDGADDDTEIIQLPWNFDIDDIDEDGTFNNIPNYLRDTEIDNASMDTHVISARLIMQEIPIKNWVKWYLGSL